MVIETKELFSTIDYFEGFQPSSDENQLLKFEKKAIWYDKEKAESNPDYKQLIGYTIFANSYNNRIFFYRRAKNSSYRESRLQDKWSCGIGGHIEKKDINGHSVILSSIEREISEELHITPGTSTIPSLIGLINDDSDEVGKVHLGLIFLAYCNLRQIKPKDPEIAYGELIPLSEINKKAMQGCNIENWTRIILSHVEKYIFES